MVKFMLLPCIFAAICLSGPVSAHPHASSMMILLRSFCLVDRHCAFYCHYDEDGARCENFRCHCDHHHHLDDGHPNTPCDSSFQCVEACGGKHDEAVCDMTAHVCHCHAHGDISCTDDQKCVEECGTENACCHNDDHCHCDEACSDHGHPETACETDADCTTCPAGSMGHCDKPAGLCHCEGSNDHGCTSDAQCQEECGTTQACCHNDDHCHCTSPC